MGFQFDEKGWAHITPLGEFEHAGAGVVQVIDAEAAKAMVDDFKAKASADNFPGLLVDFDHFSMDTDKPSEAAGWICDLRHDSKGVWAQVRWTDKGKESVEGGVYRLVSPVFPKPSLCESLGENRIRPREIVSVALTNEPNIKGAKPLTNRAESDETSNRWSDNARLAALLARRAKNEARKEEAKLKLKALDDARRASRFVLKPLVPLSEMNKAVKKTPAFKGAPPPKMRYYIDGAWYDDAGNFISRSKPARKLANRSDGNAKLYKWVLGKIKSGTHCPDCLSRAGKVKSIADWKAMGKPKCKCKCKLVPQ
jgi:hypothetical protein